jgi:ABC-type protease/lipase transport system fused ATPase/permease subunit
LPKGYETEVGEDGRNLSAGQRQRIGLARALYKSPRIVVLDEPNSNLDVEGEQALSSALISLRKSNATALIVTHRQSVLKYCTHLLFISDGNLVKFGPRDDVLSGLKKNSNVHDISAA